MSLPQNLLGILELWGRRVDACQDTTLQATLRALLQRLKHLVTTGDLAATGPEQKQLWDHWSTYQQTRIDQAIRAVIQPYCAHLAAGLQEEVRVASERVRLLQPHYTLAGLEEELDRVRLQPDRISEETCLSKLVQAWRFYGERPFGAHTKDYIEAFAWGIGIDAGTRGLVDFLSKIGLPH